MFISYTMNIGGLLQQLLTYFYTVLMLFPLLNLFDNFSSRYSAAEDEDGSHRSLLRRTTIGNGLPSLTCPLDSIELL